MREVAVSVWGLEVLRPCSDLTPGYNLRILAMNAVPAQVAAKKVLQKAASLTTASLTSAALRRELEEKSVELIKEEKKRKQEVEDATAAGQMRWLNL